MLKVIKNSLICIQVLSAFISSAFLERQTYSVTSWVRYVFQTSIVIYWQFSWTTLTPTNLSSLRWKTAANYWQKEHSEKRNTPLAKESSLLIPQHSTEHKDFSTCIRIKLSIHSTHVDRQRFHKNKTILQKAPHEKSKSCFKFLSSIWSARKHFQKGKVLSQLLRQQTLPSEQLEQYQDTLTGFHSFQNICVATSLICQSMWLAILCIHLGVFIQLRFQKTLQKLVQIGCDKKPGVLFAFRTV